MTATAIAQQIVHWIRMAVLITILLSIATILLKAFGINLPVRAAGHIELAYLAGAYWFTK